MSGSRLRLVLHRKPPAPPVLQLLTLSDYSYSNAIPEDALIATITGQTPGSTLSYAPNDGTLKFNGDFTQLLRGPSAATPGTAEYTFTETLAGAFNSPRNTPVAITVTPATQTPILQDVTVNMGAYTPPGNGTVLLRNLGLTAPGSPEVVSWRTGGVVANGGGNANNIAGLLASNTASATARSPASSNSTGGSLSSLSVITLPATSYSITVTGVGQDGSEATCTLTYVPVADAFSVGDDRVSGRPDNPTNIRLSIGTQTGGKTWLISTGCVFSTVYTIAGIIPTSGTTTVIYADPARPSGMPGFSITLACNNLIVDGLGLGGAQAHKMNIQGSSTNITVRNCYPLNASIADVNSNPATTNGVNIVSGSNLTFEDNYIEWCGIGFGVQAVTNLRVTNHKTRYHCEDARAVGSETDVVFDSCIWATPLRINSTHIDGVQNRSTVNIDDIEFRNCRWYQADGTAGMIGFQSNQATARNYRYIGCVQFGRTITAMQIGNSENWTVENCTFFRTASGLISQMAPTESDNITNSPMLCFVRPESVHSGTSNFNRVLTVGTVQTSGASWNKSECLELNLTYSATQFDHSGTNFEPIPGPSPVPTNVFKYADPYERSNNYNATTNPVGFDYVNATIDEIDAYLLDLITPAVGGDADLGGGQTIGALNLDGTFKY